jgi:hypothetical protein
MSTYDLKFGMEMIDEKLKELERHRGEVACGDHRWDDPAAKKEWFELKAVRSGLRQVGIDRVVAHVKAKNESFIQSSRSR